MKRDSRLSLSLHVVLLMMEQQVPVISELLGKRMRVNPVVVRRTMAGLRRAGLVKSIKGHGGGWIIARNPLEISILDIYRALDEPILIQQHQSIDHPECLVEQTVGHTLNEIFQEGEDLIIKRFKNVKLASLSVEFHARIAKRQSKRGR